MQGGNPRAQPRQIAHKTNQALIGTRPIQPRQRIILRIRIVIALLRAAKLIAGHQHRCATREQQRRQHRRYVGAAQLFNRLVRFAFHAVIPTVIFIVAVAVIFTVGMIVFAFKRRDVAQGHTVMCGNKIHTAGTRAIVRKQITGAAHARGEFAQHMPITAPESPHRIAVAVIPFQPLRVKAPQLITAHADIPRLSDQPHLREHGIVLNRLEQFGLRVKTTGGAPQNRRQVKTKARHAKLRHPITQTVQTQPLHARLRRIQRIAAARVVAQALFSLRLVPITAIVITLVQPAQRHRRPMLITFGGVVEHHIQNHPNAVLIQHAHGLTQLILTPRTQARIQRHHTDRIVAPRIAQAQRRQMSLIHPRGDRHQLDRIHADAFEMRHNARFTQRSDGAAQ